MTDGNDIIMLSASYEHSRGKRRGRIFIILNLLIRNYYFCFEQSYLLQLLANILASTECQFSGILDLIPMSFNFCAKNLL